MSLITVDTDLCLKDGACVAVCGPKSLVLNEAGFPEDSSTICLDCGHCAAVCATGALSHARMPADAFEPMPKALPTQEQMDGLLKSRRSIREFKDQPVSREVVLSLLDIARRAPTAKNEQNLHWIVVEGKEKVHALSKEIVNGMDSALLQPGFLEQWKRGYDFVLRGAPILVVACAPTEWSFGVEDAVIALTYFELAAEARGLGICWAGYFMRMAASHAPLRRLLNLPDGLSVRGALMVGHPQYQYHRVPPRKALSMQWS